MGQRKKIKIIKNKTFWLFVAFFIIIWVFNYFSIINLDVIWNYGFSKNFSDGLLMYKDYNMVITPLYPIVVGTLMKILGSNMIVFYVINAILATSILYVVYKLDKKIIMPFMLVILLTSEPNYDLLSTLFLFTLIYFEKEKKNDYLIGIIIGLTFLTKSSIGVFLALPTLCYFKEYKKIIKRVVGFLIPNALIMIIFLIKGNLFDYINYAFLGLFDFASGNSSFSIISILSILIISYFIYQYIKTKDIENLYIGLFQVVCIPLFNVSHFIESLIPVWYYILKRFKPLKQFYKYALCLAIIPFIFLIYNAKATKCNYTNKPFNIRYIQQEYIDDIESLKSFFQDDFDKVHFVMFEGYLYNIMLDKNPDIYSLSLKGNLGYNGEENFIKKLNNLDKGSIIVTSSIYQKGQSSEKIYNYINDNYNLIGQFRKFKVFTTN